MTTRLSIDRLRAAKAERENYVGVWLPEPMLMATPSTPEQIHELADDVSVAFLFMLERLSPDARAAFLMREVFDAEYEDIAHTLDKTQAAVRQLVRRARQQLRQGTPREAVPRATLHRLLLAFADAMQRSDFHGLHALLSDDAELIGELHRVIHRLKRDGLAELAVRVPRGDGFVSRWKFLDRRARNAAAGARTEVLVEVQRLDRVVRLDAVPGGQLRKLRTRRRFVSGIAAMPIRRFNEGIVNGGRKDVGGGHECVSSGQS